jgi:hypothetical protein
VTIQQIFLFGKSKVIESCLWLIFELSGHFLFKWLFVFFRFYQKKKCYEQETNKENKMITKRKYCYNNCENRTNHYVKSIGKIFLMAGILISINKTDATGKSITMSQQIDNACIQSCEATPTVESTYLGENRNSNPEMAGANYYIDDHYVSTISHYYYSSICSISNGGSVPKRYFTYKRPGMNVIHSSMGQLTDAHNDAKSVMRNNCKNEAYTYLLAGCKATCIIMSFDETEITKLTPPQKTAAEILTEMDGTNLAKKVIDNLNYQQVYDVNRVFE